jgi:CRP-like cAMP-binding protein
MTMVRTGSKSTSVAGPDRKERKFERIESQDHEDSLAGCRGSQLLKLEPVEIGDDDRDFLVKIMQNHFLFNCASKDDYDSVFPYMHKIATTKGQVIFSQGDKGDSCYFINSGTFSVHIDGNEVKTMEGNQTFGELALVYSMARSATIKCVAEGLLWKMDHSQFMLCMEHMSLQNNSKALQFFGSDDNFSLLSEDQQKLLAGSCTVQRFRDGEEILREGEVGEWMFIVISGKVIRTSGSGVVSPPQAEHINPILGSVGIIYGKSQICGFRAAGNVICLAIGRSSLPTLAGPIEDVLRRNAIKTLLLGDRGSDAENVFEVLTDGELNRLINHFQDAIFEKDELVFKVGDQAQMVLVVEGQCMIQEQLSSANSAVEQVLTDGMAYGEHEIIECLPMRRYMLITKKSRLHRILKSQVVQALGEPLAEAVRCNNVKKVLQDIFLFKNLKDEQIDRTVRHLETRHFNANEVIVCQDDPAKHFFLIQQGTLVSC